MSKSEIRAWESRWAIPTAICAFLGAIMLLAGNLVGTVSGEGDAAVLRSVHEQSGAVLASGLIQAAGFVLLTAPLVYLFRVVKARSDRVKPGLIGLMVAAPIFLALAAGLTAVAHREAADQFVAGEAKSTLTPREAKEKCAEERKEEGSSFLTEEYEPKQGEAPIAACERRKRADDEASNALTEASLASLSSGIGIAGVLGLIVALFYDSLWGQRTGVLSRFWGTLGMVSGIALLLGPLSVITVIWFIYFALLVAGAVPGGRPPAWEAGEAVPWPTPGEKAAAELGPAEAPGPAEPDGEGAEAAAGTAAGELPEAGTPPPAGGRRKRKQRDGGP